uniref:CUB_2 domain-containing protein n=2 Tax=Caenorhabditis tropicalis TaxID=1561998 RepID=A0A1I7U9L8_9PELO
MPMIFLVSIKNITSKQKNVLACPNGGVVFNIPQNTSVLTWYPYNFTNVVPLFPLNYECEYKINVPSGWYAQITLNVLNQDNTSSVVQVIDQLQRVEKVWTANYEYFFFIASGGTIKLSTEASRVQFGFYVTWKQYSVRTQQAFNISKFSYNPLVFKGNGVYPSIMKADTKVSVTMMSPVHYLTEYLRGIIFFDGPNWNGTSIGTGLQLLNSKTQYVSSGQYMTILFLGYYSWYDYVRMLIQDYEHTKGIVQFQGMSCQYDWECPSIVLDASTGPSVLQSYTDYSSAYDEIMSLEGTGTLEVYLGSVTENKTNMVASYKAQNNNVMRFPQEVLGKVKTYVLTEGNATIKILPSRYNFAETKEFGRKGFIVSPNYGLLSNMQSINGYIKSPNNSIANFRFYFVSANMDGGAQIKIIGRQQNKNVFTKLYNSSNPPILNLFDDFYGTDLNVQYDAGSEPTTGFYMQFEVERGSSFKSGVLAIVCSVLLFHLFK